MAKEVDPSGRRTIGVVTKIDTIEEADGSSIGDRLRGEGSNAWKFEMGCHAIRNRNQKEIQDNVSSEETNAIEARYFSTHKELSQLPEHTRATIMGFNSLVRNVTEIQSRMIREAFPKIKSKLKALLDAKRKELNALPSCVTNAVQAQTILRQLVGDLRGCMEKLYRVDYSNLSDFRGSSCPPGLKDLPGLLQSDEIYCFPWLEMMPHLQRFLEIFEKEMHKCGRHILTKEYAETVKLEFGRLHGYVLPDLMTFSAMKALASAEVASFEEPARIMLRSVHGYFSEILVVFVDKYFSAYPQLLNHVQNVVDGFLKQSLDLCSERLAEQIKIEKDEVYTLNSCYLDTVTKIMKRFDEVSFSNDAETVEDAVLIIADNQPFTKSVTITSVNPTSTTGLLVDVVNGTYHPTPMEHGGKVVYRKNQPAYEQPIWLECNETDKCWDICIIPDRSNRNSKRVAFHCADTSNLVGVGEWRVADTMTNLTLKITSSAPSEKLAHNNVERTVRETMIRLWCYQKVVCKCFCDNTAKYVREQFPRRLRDHLEAAVYDSFCHQAGKAENDSHAQAALMALMVEPIELANKRQRLQMSCDKFMEALDVLVNLERRA